MSNVMIDVETLGTDYNAVLLSIAARKFDLYTGKLYGSFHYKIDPQSCIDIGMSVTWGTIKFWLKQDKGAQSEILSGEYYAVAKVLSELDLFLDEGYVWAKSPSFDLVILKTYFQRAGIAVPWDFRNERDVRTLLNLYRDLEPKDTAILRKNSHDALQDCDNQIKQVCHCYKKIKDPFRE